MHQIFEIFGVIGKESGARLAQQKDIDTFSGLMYSFQLYINRLYFYQNFIE